MPPMTSAPSPAIAAVYQAVFDLCPPLPRWPPPWDLLSPDADCRGSINNPDQWLDHLRSRFDEDALHDADVIWHASGNAMLNSAFCNPVGCIIALRASATAEPYALLTAYGLVAPRAAEAADLPVLASLEDARTAERIADTGALFATSRIRDVVLLRAIGLPATLSRLVYRARRNDLVALDTRFGEESDPGEATALSEHAAAIQDGTAAGDQASPGADSPEPVASVAPPLPSKPLLVLIDWALEQRRSTPSMLMTRPAGHLARARRVLGLPLSGVYGWRASSAELERLEFALALRDAELLRELFRPDFVGLDDFEMLAEPCGTEHPLGEKSRGFLAAHAELVGELTRAHGEAGSFQRIREALRRYDVAVDRWLADPVRVWALAHDEPVVRCHAAHLAELLRLVHQMAARIYELQSSTSEGAGPSAEFSRALKDFLCVSRQTTSLIAALEKMGVCEW
jgi:hypothetical protein